MTHIPTMSSSALPQESENKREHSGTKSQGLVTVCLHGLSKSVFLETPLELIPLGASLVEIWFEVQASKC